MLLIVRFGALNHESTEAEGWSVTDNYYRRDKETTVIYYRVCANFLRSGGARYLSFASGYISLMTGATLIKNHYFTCMYC